MTAEARSKDVADRYLVTRYPASVGSPGEKVGGKIQIFSREMKEKRKRWCAQEPNWVGAWEMEAANATPKSRESQAPNASKRVGLGSSRRRRKGIVGASSPNARGKDDGRKNQRGKDSDEHV
jgi:hypothetical protein